MGAAHESGTGVAKNLAVDGTLAAVPAGATRIKVLIRHGPSAPTGTRAV